MVEQGSFFSLVNEEIASLSWFEEFMRKRCRFSGCLPHVISTKPIGRVGLEQQMYVEGDIGYEPGTDRP